MKDKDEKEKLRVLQDIIRFEDEGGPCPPTCELHVKRKDEEHRDYT